MEISWRPFVFGDMKMHYFVFENSKNDGDIIFRFILSKVILHKDCFLFVYIISSFVNSWRYLLEINLSNSFTSAWHFSISCSWSWWKRQNLLGFLVFEPLFIRVGYNKKSFSFMEANTLALVVVKDVVLSLGNVKQSWMCPLMLLFYSIIRYWWHDKDSSCVWKRGWPCLVTLVFFPDVIFHRVFDVT